MIIPTIFPRTNPMTYPIFGWYLPFVDGRISHGSRDTKRPRECWERYHWRWGAWRPPVGWWMATWRFFLWPTGWKKLGIFEENDDSWWLNGLWFSIQLGIPPSSYLLKPDHDFFFRSWRELSKLATFWTWFQTWISHRNVSRFFITVSKRLTTPVTSHQVSVQWGSPIYFSSLWCPWHHACKVPVSLERTVSLKIPWDSPWSQKE